MSRQYKPRAYLEKLCNGYFVFSPVFCWRSTDRWGNLVAYGRTRKECERNTRERGYVPERV